MDKVYNTMHNPETGKHKPPRELVKFLKIYGELNEEDKAEHNVRSDKIINITTTNYRGYRCIVRLSDGSIIKSYDSVDDIIGQMTYVVEE